MSKDQSLEAEYARLLLRRLIAEPVHASPTADALIDAWSAGDSTQTRQLCTPGAIEEILKLNPSQYAQVCAHLERICDRTEIDVVRKGQGLQDAKVEIANVRAANAERILKELTSARAAVPVVPAPSLSSVESVAEQREPEQRKSLRLSEYERSFFALKRYPKHTESQNTATFRLWKEINGDLPIDGYTRAHVQDFRIKLRMLPASHGKGKHIHALEAIKATNGQPADRMKEKTVKRHISCLRQLWLHVGEDAANLKIFDNMSFDLEESDRLPWTDDALDRLLRARWPQNHVSEETHAWIFAIGGYTGARLEEIARLRPEDVRERDTVPCLEIRNQYETQPGRRRVKIHSTKTPAGNRAVPIHPKLMALGLWELAQHRRAAGHTHLFDLRATGPQRKLSVEYSRLFSNHKTGIGIGPEHVFHSLRHNVETILGSASVRQEWIDAFMGHSSGSKSIGVKVYLHGIKTDVLRQVAYAVEYPPEVCPTLLLRRVRGEIPW